MRRRRYGLIALHLGAATLCAWMALQDYGAEDPTFVAIDVLGALLFTYWAAQRITGRKW